MSLYYVMRDGKPVQTDDVREWAKEQTDVKRQLAKTELRGGEENGGVTISTVFLGIDHAHDGGVPVLWETMIFGGIHSEEMARYRSERLALAGHTAYVQSAAKDLS